MERAFDGEVVVKRKRFTNEENGFAVVDAESDGDEIVLVGHISHLENRERVRVVGSWVIDSRYGEQLKVSEAHPLAPGDADQVVAYLKRIDNIGEKRARALVERHGPEGTLDAVDRDPAGSFRRVGLDRRRAEAAAMSWNELRSTRRLHMLLAPHGLAYLVKRLNDEYPRTAHRVVTENPYELTRIFGVGFRVADRIARAGSSGSVEQIPGRAAAAVVYALSEAEGRGGNTCLPIGELLARANALLRNDDLPELGGFAVDGHGSAGADEETVESLSDDGDVLRDGSWVYRAATWQLEHELADRILAMVEPDGGSVADGRLRDVEPDTADTGELALTAEQRTGVRHAFRHRLSVITGGPGTGKTASIRTIAALASDQGAKLLLVAPTGRAARRMTEASGTQAKTVHSALGWVPGELPEFDEEQPLNVDLLILDESSMANLELMVTLLRAVPPTAHLVLVGDADQLAPVGAGKPFADLVASEAVPIARLDHIFRQAAGSMIVQGAHAIRRGETPDFSQREEMRRDLFMIERRNVRDALAEIVELVGERLPKHYGVDPVEDIQVFAPVYRGELGIDALNRALREKLNPDGIAVRGGRLRLGDKLMMTGRNLHELGLMNGTVLRLLDEIESHGGDDPALVLRSDEQTFRLPVESSESLQLGYACSVHRGQGIELPVAVIVAHERAGAFFLRREMLYTAITRAKVATVIVGSRDVVARAARATDTESRYSRLGELLRVALRVG